jgi:hypothetical protein
MPSIEHGQKKVLAVSDVEPRATFRNLEMARRLRFDKCNTGIRRARPSDAIFISELASAVNIFSYSNQQRGFLVYSLPPSEYRKRIADKQCVYIFELEGKSVGFICGYNERGLVRYSRDQTLSHESQICSAVIHFAVRRKISQFVFLDQISIVPELQDRGLGETYFRQFCQNVRGPFYVAMLESPIRNPRIDYWVKRGFARIGEALERLPHQFGPKDRTQTSSDELLWGIYLLEE